MKRLAKPRLMALLGIVAVIFIVVAGANLFGMVGTNNSGNDPIKQEIAGISSTPELDAQTAAAFEKCIGAGYVGIGVDPEVSDQRVDFLVESAGSAEEAARLIAETWCGAFIESELNEISDEPSSYRSGHLMSWAISLREFSRFERDIALASSAGGSASKRLWYIVRTELNRKFILAKAVEEGIPRDAIDVVVWESLGPNVPSVKSSSDYGIEISFGYSFSGEPGDEMQFDVELANTGEGPVGINHGEESTTEIFVLTEDGRQVWRSGAYLIAESGRESLIEPGKSVHFEKMWPVINDDVFSLSSGRFLLRACANFSYDRSLTDGEYVKEELCTETISLTLGTGE